MREPEWTDEDRGWVLALLAEQRDTCQGCGYPLEECRDPASMHQWRIVQDQCEACRMLDMQRDIDAESTTKRRGMHTGVIRIIS